MDKKREDGFSRRSFLAGTAGLASVAVPEWFHAAEAALAHEHTAGQQKKFGANDQINFAVIGPGGSKGGYRQGLGDTRNASRLPGVKVIAACDVDATHLTEAAAAFGPDTKKYSDFRELLANKDIDAVVIGTPDHWHAIIAIAAMKAGKDVYCEKPLTLTIDEGKKIVQVQKATKRVFQTGSQQRSDARFRLACELVRNGRIGKLKKVTAHLPTAPKGGPFPVETPPPDFNWDFWLGPAAMVPYTKNRTHGNFRWWLEYSGGMMTDWGAHHNDIAQWGMGMDRSGPVSIEGMGTRTTGHDSYNVFQDFEIIHTYANGVTLVTTNLDKKNGVTFEGEGGTIFVSRSEITASDPKLLSEPLPADAKKLYFSNNHMGNFVECIRSRKDPICDAEIGHRSVTVCHLGNICLRLDGRKLAWDPQKEVFKNDREANAMLTRPMRGSWKLA